MRILSLSITLIILKELLVKPHAISWLLPLVKLPKLPRLPKIAEIDVYSAFCSNQCRLQYRLSIFTFGSLGNSGNSSRLDPTNRSLLNYFRDGACTNGPSTFSDGNTQSLFHGH